MPAWRTDPATRRERRPSGGRCRRRARRLATRGRWLDRAGPKRPCRSPRTRSRRDRPGSSRRARRRRGPLAPDRASASPRRSSITASALASGPRLRSRLTGRSCPDRSPVPRDCRSGFDLVVVEPGGSGRATTRHAKFIYCGRPASATRATLPPGSGYDPEPRPNPSPTLARGAHTRTVPTGTVPAGPVQALRSPATRSAEEETDRRSPPCRPFRCGSCSRPESTSATRPAAGTPR